MKGIKVSVFIVVSLLVSVIFAAIETLIANHLFSASALMAVFGVSRLTISRAWLFDFLLALLLMPRPKYRKEN